MREGYNYLKDFNLIRNNLRESCGHDMRSIKIRNRTISLGGLILLFTAAGLLTFGPTYATYIPDDYRLFGLIALLLVSFAAAIAFHRISHLR